MSPANLDHIDAHWQDLLRSAVVDREPPDLLGRSGTWLEQDGWHHRPSHWIEVRLAEGPVEGITAEFEDDAVGPDEVARAIVMAVSDARLRGHFPDWPTARKEIGARLSRGIGAVAIGGVRSGAEDAEGFARSLQLGEHALAGHLELSIDASARDLARRHGLPGYRFSDESWWTEDFLSSKEDEYVGAELMEELAAAGSWPWLALVVAAPASGAAIESAAVAAGQALLGAIVLLDQAPGRFWNESVPWIAGGLGPAVDPRCPGQTAGEFAFSIAPQHVDGQARQLDNAESILEGAPARVIDLAAHAEGPAGNLLVAVLDSSLGFGERSESLAKACRLSWLAAASETADTALMLSRAAAAELLDGRETEMAGTQAEIGANWRLEHENDWPEGQPYAAPPDVAGWSREMTDAIAFLGAAPTAPSWGFQASGQAAIALGVVQALFFAHGAELSG